jgi:uncharacterized protein YfaS (alpha-2-macroglobulin family)
MYAPAANETVNYILKDSEDNEISKGSARLNALAGFDFKVTLPATMNLGAATVQFELARDKSSFAHHFQVQEFRRPEFEINVKASEAPHFVGSFATVAMSANYYAGGDVAEILVQSPFAPAEGVLTLRRSGLLKTERFTMRDNSYTPRVLIEEAMTPNVHLQVDLVGAETRVDDAGNLQTSLPKRPAFASGEINLEIPPVKRRLNVAAAPRDKILEPGAETVVDVEVQDEDGRSVAGTDTAVVVVDEAVLALTNYKLEDPLSVFYSERDEDVNDYHSRANVKLTSPELLKLAASNSELTQRDSANSSAAFIRQIISLPVTGANAALDSLALLSPGRAMESVSVAADAADTLTQKMINVRRNFNALAVFAALGIRCERRGQRRSRIWRGRRRNVRS